MPPAHAAKPTPSVTAGSGVRRVQIDEACVASRELLNQDGKLWIEHGGEKYMLRRTANNRLILTK